MIAGFTLTTTLNRPYDAAVEAVRAAPTDAKQRLTAELAALEPAEGAT